MGKILSNTKEWNNYDSADKGVDRCGYVISSDPKGITKEIEHLGLAPAVAARANQIFLEVTRETTVKKNSRKSLIFACIFRAYKEQNMVMDVQKLQQSFGIRQKKISEALRIVQSKITAQIPPTMPIDLVMPILRNFFAAEPPNFDPGFTAKEAYSDIEKIYNNVYSKSSILRRAKPQSVAYGLIYFYLKQQGWKESRAEFTRRFKSNITDVTILRMFREIEQHNSFNDED